MDRQVVNPSTACRHSSFGVRCISYSLVSPQNGDLASVGQLIAVLVLLGLPIAVLVLLGMVIALLAHLGTAIMDSPVTKHT